MSADCLVYVGTWDGERRLVERCGDGDRRPLEVPRSHLDAADDNSWLYEWGTRNNRTRLLAEAILVDTFGLREATPQLVSCFAEEILAALPQDDFELFQFQVREWACQREDELRPPSLG